MIPIRVKY